MVWGCPKIGGTILGVPITRMICSYVGVYKRVPTSGKLPYMIIICIA